MELLFTDLNESSRSQMVFGMKAVEEDAEEASYYQLVSILRK
jgi:hypothetical protein